MNKVWIVEGWVAYEGSWPEKVFSSLEKAEEFRATLPASNEWEGFSITEYEVE